MTTRRKINSCCWRRATAASHRIMSMRRWRLAAVSSGRRAGDFQRSFPEDVIFAEEWRNYPVTRWWPSTTRRTLCRGAPEPRAAAKRAGYCEPHRDDLRPGAVHGDRGEEVKALNVTTSSRAVLHACSGSGDQQDEVHGCNRRRPSLAAMGTTLLGLPAPTLPVAAACRARVCSCCKTKVVSGEYTVTSTMTLTDAARIAEGYVLACSCHPQGDLVLA